MIKFLRRHLCTGHWPFAIRVCCSAFLSCCTMEPAPTAGSPMGVSAERSFPRRFCRIGVSCVRYVCYMCTIFLLSYRIAHISHTYSTHIAHIPPIRYKRRGVRPASSWRHSLVDFLFSYPSRRWRTTLPTTWRPSSSGTRGFFPFEHEDSKTEKAKARMGMPPSQRVTAGQSNPSQSTPYSPSWLPPVIPQPTQQSSAPIPIPAPPKNPLQSALCVY